MGIRVNAIAPGLIESPGQRGTNTDEEITEKVKAIPLQRIGQPRDIGDAVLSIVTTRWWRIFLEWLDAVCWGWSDFGQTSPTRQGLAHGRFYPTGYRSPI